MRYTRYEYKKISKVKFLVTVSIITLISIGGGLYVSNFVFQGKQIENSLKPSSEVENGNQEEKFMVLQCGYYAREENAKELLTSIAKYCEPFIVEDGGKYRVLAGIYKEEDGVKKIQEFKANNIDIAKVSLKIQGDKLEIKKITEVIDGFLTISNKLEEKEVKSIKTSEFKEWADTVINDGGIKSKKLEDLNNYVKDLPEEIGKDSNNKNFQELYKFIKNQYNS